MFPFTRASAHPSGKSVAYQSGDNQIVGMYPSQPFLLFLFQTPSKSYVRTLRYVSRSKEKSLLTRAMLTPNSLRINRPLPPKPQKELQRPQRKPPLPPSLPHTASNKEITERRFRNRRLHLPRREPAQQRRFGRLPMLLGLEDVQDVT